MKKVLLLVCLMLTFAIFANRSVFSQDSEINTWSAFRGNNSSGVARPDQDPPVEFSSDKNVIWKTPLISGVSSPCIWGDRIFLTGFDEEKQQLQVMCYNRLNGKLIWNQIVPAKEIEPCHAVSSPADATPATDGERIYVHFGSYGLLCYDFDGDMLWSIELPVNSNNYGTGTSPIVMDDKVILKVSRPNGERYLIAVDSKSGKQVWKNSNVAGTGSASTPIVWNGDLIIHGGRRVAAYSIKDGSEIWQVMAITNGASTPVAYSDKLYVGTWFQGGEQNQRPTIPEYHELLNKFDKNKDGLISKQEVPDDFYIARRPEIQEIADANPSLIAAWDLYVDLDHNNTIDKSEWQKFLDLIYNQLSADHGLIAIKSGANGNISSENIIWKVSENVPEVPSPLYYKDRVYMIKNGGIASCMNALTGELLYCERLGVSGPYISSPVVANDQIYIASHRGIVVVFEAGDELKVLAKNDLDEKILATPAIVDNKLYVRTANHLYAFGE
ncbi:PQQ-binding-like beta-propeller repeat protein [Candidatus Latescibacterota bacterium]